MQPLQGIHTILICELMAHLCGGAKACDSNQSNNKLLADDLAASTKS
jgi:hypothetical protein